MTRRTSLIDDQTRFVECLVIELLKTIAGGWLLMIMVDRIHGEWITQLPTLGFITGIVVVGAARGVIYCLKPSSD